METPMVKIYATYFQVDQGKKVFLKVYIISREKCGKMLIFGELGE